MATGIVVKGLDEALTALNGLQADLRKPANAELRAASKQIAAGAVPLMGGSGAPQEGRLIASLGPRSDRLVTVAVVRKPKLSGMKRTPAAKAKGAVFWPVELGSDAPQFKGPPVGGIVAKNRDRIARYAIPRYTEALSDILVKWGLL